MESSNFKTLSRLEIILASSDQGKAMDLRQGLLAEDSDIKIKLVEDLIEAAEIISRDPGQVVLWCLETLTSDVLNRVERFAFEYPGAVLVVVAERAGQIRPEALVFAGAQDCLYGAHGPGGLLMAIRTAAARSLSGAHLGAEGRLYRSIVFRQSELVCRFNTEGDLTFSNPAYRRYFGIAQNELPRGSFFQHVVISDREEFMNQLGALNQEQSLTRMEIRVLPGPNSERRWMRWSIHAIYDKSGALREYQAVGQDITEGKYLEDALQMAEASLRQLIISNADGMVVTDEAGIVMFANPAAERLLGKSSFDLLGNTFEFQVRPGQRQELELNPGTKETVIAEMRVVETKWRRAKAYLATLRDISELKQLQEELRDLSLIDPLTGVYNRRGFTTLARQQLRTAQRMGRRMHLYFVDLDDLKQINDTMGHNQGDQVIRETALVLKATFRESDILGRWGGDEFSVLAMETDEEGTQAALERLNQNLDDWNTDTARAYKISFSTGTSTFDPESPSTLDTLLTEADRNMYEVKRDRQEKLEQSLPVRLRSKS
jgi:diguanylate cyclase (GGDEF)-like protein/PAS domain S-box-containing protein